MNCPSCNAKLDQDFGMVTCQSCKAVLMIDISGKIQTATDVPHPFDGDESSDFEDESVIEEPQEDNFNEGFDESDELVASGVDEENSIEEPEGDFFEETEQHDDADFVTFSSLGQPQVGQHVIVMRGHFGKQVNMTLELGIMVKVGHQHKE